MTAIPVGVGSLRAAAAGDTLPLSTNLSLRLDWTSKVPVDVTVTGPSGRTAKARLEPSQPGQMNPNQSVQVPLWNETTATGADGLAVAGTVTYVMANGAAVSGVNVCLVNQ
jgi:hypothetical protein